MAPRDTYNSSLATAHTNLVFGGAAGQGNGTLITNNTQEYPSLVAIEAAYSSGQITAAQRTALRHASNMNEQVQARAARDILVNGGDVGPG